MKVVILALSILAISIQVGYGFNSVSARGVFFRAALKSVVRSDNKDLGFTPWKPKQGTNEYGSTDTADFFESDDVKQSGLKKEL